jgi:hypothetical protein
VNKTRIQAAAAVLVAAGAAVAIVAAAPASAKPAGQTISFTERQISDRNFNLGPAHGIAVGAVELSANTLMQGSKQIGRDGVSCTITRLSAQSADDLCSDILALAGGQIDLAGLVPSTPQGPGTFQLAVTGGTGRYQDARGYATIVPSQNPKVTVHLTS